ncbi:MAG: hypothetical protein WC366_01570 [Bacilli bacterium]
MKNNKIVMVSSLSLLSMLLFSCGVILPSNSNSVSESISSSTSDDLGMLVSIIATDDNTYSVGEVYSESNSLVVVAQYQNGTENIPLEKCAIAATSFPDLDRVYSSDQPFEAAGEYSFTITYRRMTSTVSVDVSSLVGTSHSLDSFVVVNNKAYSSNTYLKDVADLSLTLTWSDCTEYINYSSSLDSYFNMSLVKSTDLNTNVINNVLEKLTDYILTMTYIHDGASVSATCSFSCEKGYVKPETLRYIATDVDKYAPASGAQKVLVVPVILQNCSDFSFTSTVLNNIDTYYFGAKEDTPSSWNSLKSYFETSSYGKLTITGAIASIYTSPTISKTDLYGWDSTSMNNLYSLIESALNSAETDIHGDHINLDDYDSDDDGYIDSFHVILNASDGNSNENCRWPHMAGTGTNPGTKAKPTANVYSSTNLGHVSSSDGARTSIHEQGHIFGLDDYYNYIYDNTDFVGCADMQSFNRFDWNPFSKMTVGWVQNPYVIDGTSSSTKIDIRPFANSGDVIIIPANYSSWNGSAYDEYIIVEYFANVGNNAGVDWTYWNSNCGNLGSGGIRIYHADGRLYGYNSSYYDNHIIDNSHPLSNYMNAKFACSNSTGTESRAVYGYEDYHLLHVIQQGNVNTFADASSYYSMLSNEDLFHANDTFSIGSHSGYTNYGPNFFYNNNKMNSGTTFPYGIKIDSLNATGATISITRF